ncbi:hypothetical protein CENSYa_1889 [Cenarchaeum symbiosum A]|uniref:Uncharacterized protein n=1 Tax=Cenarchaeum symbiosum (strain A) TaxID=414004 RepID=A0RYT1_CENSY|nr:hypothetical protein CENSYa_1889 [Cenarchaeum symbiosum A]
MDYVMPILVTHILLRTSLRGLNNGTRIPGLIDIGVTDCLVEELRRILLN